MPRPKNRTVNKNRGRDQFVGDGPITVNNNNHLSESVLEKLTPHISTNALHNAKARANRRPCLEGTRGGFIEKLGKWIENPRGKHRVLWVKAGAGVGKTAIAQTLCERYCKTEDSQGLLAAYFFSRSDASRNSMNRFVPTLAYQLARSSALRIHLADSINAAICSDPSIVGADWEDQFERLISEPCNRIEPETWETLPRLIIIDGLDECMDTHEPQTSHQRRYVWERDGQRRLLSIIQNSVTAPSPLPLRFLIFSRPEHTISNFFHSRSIPNLMQLDMRELRSEADSDIYLYLRQEFARLVELRPDAGLDKSWPGKKAIRRLTRMSDGHFIYVVTAVKYVMDDDPSSTPQERLDIILRPETSKSPDLSPLDRLYLQILQPFVDIREQLLLPLLQQILTSQDPSYYDQFEYLGYMRIPDDIYRRQQVLAELVSQVDSPHISIVLSRLRSVLYVPEDEHGEAVSVLHASFSDFLGDQRRSNDFHVEWSEDPEYYDKLCQALLRVLKRVILRYGNDQDCIRPREPPVIEAWAFNTWSFLVQGIEHGALGLGAKSLQAVDEFDVYHYVNMLNDGSYLQPLKAYLREAWGQFIAYSLLRLSQVYAFLTRPPSDKVIPYLSDREYLSSARSKSRHKKSGPFFQFFEEDCVAVLPKQYSKVCYLQLKLLIGCLWDPTSVITLWDPIISGHRPTSYYGSSLDFPDDGDESSNGTLKIFPHDVPAETLARSMTIEDCQIWRFGLGPRGTFKFRQVMIAPTANGDFSWVTLPSESSDLYEWMDDFAKKEIKRAKKKQGAMKKQVRRVAVSFSRLLCLGPELEEEEEEGEGEEKVREWEEFLREDHKRRGIAHQPMGMSTGVR